MFSYTDDGAKNCVVIKTFENTVIKEVNADCTLPDYLPDVSRILRADARVCRAGKYINGSSLEYDGTVNFSIIYSTADGIVKNAEFSSDYGGSMPLGDFSGDCSVDADTELDSVTVRLQNPRKLSAKARVSVSAQINCLDCASPAVTGRTGGGDDIRCKTENIDCCFGIEASDTDVSVSEDIAIASPLPAIDEIVSVFLDPYLYERVKSANGFVELSTLFDEVPDTAIDDYGIRFSETEFAKYFDALDCLPVDSILCLRRQSTVGFGGDKANGKAYEFSVAFFKSIVNYIPD